MRLALAAALNMAGTAEIRRDPHSAASLFSKRAIKFREPYSSCEDLLKRESKCRHLLAAEIVEDVPSRSTSSRKLHPISAAHMKSASPPSRFHRQLHRHLRRRLRRMSHMPSLIQQIAPNNS